MTTAATASPRQTGSSITAGRNGTILDGKSVSSCSSIFALWFMFQTPSTRANMDQRSDEVQSNGNDVLSNDDKVKTNRKKGMSDICVAQGLLRDAFPPRRYGKVESAFYEAHKFISRRVRKDFTMRRVRSIWEGTARRIDSEEMDALREAVREEARREQIEIRARLASLDEKIAEFDAFTARKAVESNR